MMDFKSERVQFRIWDGETRKMVYPGDKFSGHYKIDMFGNISCLDCWCGDSVLLLRSVDLKRPDKNNRIIYQSDIIKSYDEGHFKHYYLNADEIFVVQYSMNRFCGTPVMLPQRAPEWCGGGELEWWAINDDKEVIGNIYENPDLLKDPKKANAAS